MTDDLNTLDDVILLWSDMASTYKIVKVIKLLKKLKTLTQEDFCRDWSSNVKSVDLSCDISTFEKDCLKGFWDNFYDNHNLLL